jgi:CheY-like chemotaxis protein
MEMGMRGRYRVVLVVDDEPDLREYAQHVLRERGFLVLTSADAEAALEAMRHVIVDVLFTDLVMPGTLDGIQLAHAARRMNPAIKIVCTTGFARISDSEMGEACERLLRKPYRPDQLAAEIESVLAA